MVYKRNRNWRKLENYHEKQKLTRILDPRWFDIPNITHKISNATGINSNMRYFTHNQKATLLISYIPSHLSMTFPSSSPITHILSTTPSFLWISPGHDYEITPNTASTDNWPSHSQSSLIFTIICYLHNVVSASIMVSNGSTAHSQLYMNHLTDSIDYESISTIWK